MAPIILQRRARAVRYFARGFFGVGERPFHADGRNFSRGQGLRFLLISVLFLGAIIGASFLLGRLTAA